MKKLIEHFNDYPMIETKKHDYIRYRLGRIKHELWLKNRKNKDKIIIDSYDRFIIENLKTGNTCIFGCAGYYLEELIKNLTVVEQWPIVKEFYPKAQIISHRSEISKNNGKYFDNFISTNPRGDHWCTIEDLVDTHVSEYVKTMKDGCLFFYSFRDTQMLYNRLKNNHYEHFNNFGILCEKKLNLNILWKDIQFTKKLKDSFGNYNMEENPDTTNGNIKFI